MSSRELEVAQEIADYRLGAITLLKKVDDFFYPPDTDLSDETALLVEVHRFLESCTCPPSVPQHLTACPIVNSCEHDPIADVRWERGEGGVCRKCGAVLPGECPRDLLTRCNHADASRCCGGGSDAPCDCSTCHPSKTKGDAT